MPSIRLPIQELYPRNITDLYTVFPPHGTVVASANIFRAWFPDFHQVFIRTTFVLLGVRSYVLYCTVDD